MHNPLNLTPTQLAALKIRDHKRTERAWVLKHTPERIEYVAELWLLWPTDGAGRLRVAVWADNRWQVSSANGCGYDKLTACLAGMTFGGVELGDHCDHKGRPTHKQAAKMHGWTLLGL